MAIKDQIDQNGENWKMVIKDKNCLNDQKWSASTLSPASPASPGGGSYLGLLPHSGRPGISAWADTPGVKYDQASVFYSVLEYCFDNHGSDLVFIWKLMNHDWMTALKMLDDAIKIQKDECQKDLTAHLWIRLFIKSDDWGWMLGPGLHWVRMTNVGSTSY